MTDGSIPLDPPIDPAPVPAPPRAETSPPTPRSPSAPGGVPLARPAGTAKSVIGDKPILDIEGDSCPNCGAQMPGDAVVCLRCGFDQKAGVIRKPEVSVQEVEPEPVKPEFVVPARLSAQTLAMIGAGITIGAMVAAGVTTHAQSWGIVALAVLVTLYQTLLHAATGAAAVGIAARIAEERLGPLDLALARMFVAFALFELVLKCAIPGTPEAFSKSVVFIVGAGAYFLALMILFKKDHTRAGMIAIAHAALYAFVSAGEWLSVWLYTGMNAHP